MARTRFAPPPASPAADPAPLPARRRSGSFVAWQLGRVEPTETPLAEPETPAEDPIDVARAQAEAEGLAQGLQDGRAAGRAAYDEALGRLSTGLAEIGQLRDVLGEAYRREVIELALAAAEALVQRELTQSSEVIVGLVDQALEVLGADAPITLTLSPDDAERLPPPPAGVEVQVDEELPVGDLRAESAGGSIESSMQRRIARVRQLVLGELDGGTA